jgi:hypothetical protein
MLRISEEDLVALNSGRITVNDIRRKYGILDKKRLRISQSESYQKRYGRNTDAGAKYMPTRQEIEAGCLKVQATWDDDEFQRRAGFGYRRFVEIVTAPEPQQGLRRGFSVSH